MAISAQSNAKRVYPQHPKGAAQLVLIGIVDRGLQENIFDPTKPDAPKLSFHFESAELNDEDDSIVGSTADGNRFNLSKWVTNSDWYDKKTGKMSGMVAMLCEWLDCTPDEIPTAVFEDLECLCGLNCRARVIRKANSNGEMRASIASFEPWDGAEIISPEEAVGEGDMFRGKTFEQFKIETGWNDAAPAPKKKIASRQPSADSNVPEDISSTQTFEQSRSQHVKDLAAGKDVTPMTRPPRPPVPAPAMEADDGDGDGDPFDDTDDTPITLDLGEAGAKAGSYGKL